MDGLGLSVRLLLLLGVANLAPLVARRLFRSRWQTPLDGGLRFVDGRPLLGPSKTVRGVVAAVVASTVCALLLGIPIDLGALIGAMAMLGDALSSFVKRRLGVAPSAEVIGLDQVPESLLPLLAVQAALSLSALQIAGVTAAFVAFGIPLARLVRRRHLRKST
jgi:CDP-archaeol synthase